jgi:hypothetical protein
MLLCKDARTGKITVFVVATGSHVKEAVYVPKNMVFKLSQSDIKEFRLTMHQ